MSQYSTDCQRTPNRAAAVIALAAGLLALVLRWYFVTHAQVLQAVNLENVRSDASQYYHYAWNIVHRGIFSGALPSATAAYPDSFRDPVYPLFLSMVLKLTDNFDTFYAAVLITQAVLGSLTVSLLTIAGRHYLPLWALTTAALLMAIWPHSVSIPAYMLTETLTGFICAVALLLTEKAPLGRILSSVICGVAWSIAGLTNAVLLPAATVLAFVLWLSLQLGGRAALTLALASLILPMAWGIRSTALFSSASSTSRAATNFVQGSWPTYHDAFQLAAQGDINGIHHLQWMQYEIDTLQSDPAAGLVAMGDRIGQRPIAHLIWYLWKPELLWAWDIRIGQGDIYVYPTRNSPFFRTGPLWPLEAICYIANPFLAALMLLGVIKGVARRDEYIVAKATAIVALFVTIVYSVLQSEPRYSIPFRGFEMLLAMYGFKAAADLLSALHKATPVDEIEFHDE